MALQPESRGAALTLEGLTKVYGHDTVLDDVSLTVGAGEFVTLLGPSGSGKTTTLSIIAGFTAPTSGRVMLDGEDITSLPTHKRGIGVVFQNYALFPHMTVRENIAFPLKQRKTSKPVIESKIAEVLDLVDLAKYSDRYPIELSGGQQQRVALARALVFGPRLLLLDEPLAALDRKLRETLQYELKRIHQEVGITFLCVTHDQEEALVLADNIALYNDGKVEQFGAPQELYETPRSYFVANFLGSSNMLPAEVVSDREVTLSEGTVLLGPMGAGGISPGEPCTLMIRPDALRPQSSLSSSSDNAIQGTIQNVLYLGTELRYEVTTAHGTQLVASSPTRSGFVGKSGDSVVLCWQPSDASLLTATRN